MIDFTKYQFAPVIHLPSDYEVYDFTQGYDPGRVLASPFGIGKYDEKRAGMYTTEIFERRRDIHVGIDIGAPIGTPVHAFFKGEIFLVGYNSAAGDYGATMITHHVLGGHSLWALHGHLSKGSIEDKKTGQQFEAGDIIAWVGDRNENGGWNPHLHFQLSFVEPLVCDMPGVVSDEDRVEALRTYPDPRLVLGRLY